MSPLFVLLAPPPEPLWAHIRMAMGQGTKRLTQPRASCLPCVSFASCGQASAVRTRPNVLARAGLTNPRLRERALEVGFGGFISIPTQAIRTKAPTTQGTTGGARGRNARSFVSPLRAEGVNYNPDSESQYEFRNLNGEGVPDRAGQQWKESMPLLRD